MKIKTPRLTITTFSPDMAQSVYENSQDDDTRRFVPDEVYGICLAENTASVRVLRKCDFIQVFQGLGNYQGKEVEIIKTIIRADIV